MYQWRAWRWLQRGLLLAGLLLALPISGLALDTPPAPKNCPVQDIAAVIDTGNESALCAKLLAYQAKTGNQIAVLTIKTLNGEDIEGYANRVARAWGVGDKTANNGVLFVAAIDDRKMRIEVGRGLEPELTDLESNQIITQKIRPFFQRGDYAGGIAIGTDSMIAVIGGERLSGSTKSPGAGDIGALALLLLQFGFIPLLYLAAFLARSKSWWAGGIIGAVPGVVLLFSHLIAGFIALAAGIGLGLLLDFILSNNYKQRVASGDKTTWWGSGGGFFGGSSGDSGGWGGFGGGNFGGGGSSCSW